MLARDKLDIANNLRMQGFDITTKPLAPMVAHVENYARMRRLQASEQENEGAVDRFIEVSKDRCAAVLKNGQQVPVSKKTYYNELPYNYLPAKYKTLVL